MIAFFLVYTKLSKFVKYIFSHLVFEPVFDYCFFQVLQVADYVNWPLLVQSSTAKPPQRQTSTESNSFLVLIFNRVIESNFIEVSANYVPKSANMTPKKAE